MVRSFLANDALAVDDAGAIDQAMQGAEGFDRRLHRALRARLVGHVGADETYGNTKFLGQRITVALLQVSQHGVAALRHDHPRRTRAQARCATGNEEC
jgi:hypothetical protein